MKKKGKTSTIVKICLLFTAVMMSFLGLFWLSSKHKETAEPILEVLPPRTVQNKEKWENISQTRLPVVDRVPETPKVAAAKDDKIHFIHIPKCGGTTMTTLLRQIQCTADPIRNSDCCLNPGFCDWHAHRRCSTIMGCINHFPNRKFIYQPMKSIAVLREPISRYIRS